MWLGRNASILGTMIVGDATSLLGNVQLGFSSSNTISFDSRVSTNILPNTNGTRELGGSSNHWDDVFSETLTLRGTSGKTSTTERYLTADSLNIILQTLSGDGFLVKSGSSEIFEVQSNGTIVPKGDIDISFGDTVDFNESQSSAGAGIATALPSKPEAYIKVKLNGTVGVVPWYPLT